MWCVKNLNLFMLRANSAPATSIVAIWKCWDAVSFAISILAESHHENLIVDCRGNCGGYVSTMLLEKLCLRCAGRSIPRQGDCELYPSSLPCTSGRVVVLVDEKTSSDGEYFAAAVQTLKLGKVVGTRTWGGVNCIGEISVLCDGTKCMHASSGYITADGRQLENCGVVPDEEIFNIPCERSSDHQLEVAILLSLSREEA